MPRRLTCLDQVVDWPMKAYIQSLPFFFPNRLRAAWQNENFFPRVSCRLNYIFKKNQKSEKSLWQLLIAFPAPAQKEPPEL